MANRLSTLQEVSNEISEWEAKLGRVDRKMDKLRLEEFEIRRELVHLVIKRERLKAALSPSVSI